MTLHPDRLGAALTAVALIETSIESPAATAPLISEDMDVLEALTVLSSAIWCARLLTLQLAELLDAAPTEVTGCLRGALIDVFNESHNNTSEE